MIGFLIAASLYWNAPTTREDGAPLPPEEISHYEMTHDGQFYDTTTETTMEVSAEGVYRIRCVDIYGESSLDSNSVTVSSKKARPSPPGQLRKNR